jgi:hypothetical protein
MMKTRIIVLTAILALLTACSAEVPAARVDSPVAPEAPDIVSFIVNPSKVENGSAAMLQWEVKNADSITIDNGIGAVDSKGSKSVKPYDLTTYNLTARNAGGEKTFAVIVNVIPFVRVSSPATSQAQSTGGIPSSSLPRLAANESYVFFNQAVMVGADDHFIVLHNNPAAHNPTWAELKAFLETDNTDRHAYIPGKYTCGDFAETLHNNAEAAGIRAAIVAIELKSPTMAGAIINHSLDAFETTDRGIMYIDDTSSTAGYFADKLAALKIGDDYICTSIFPQPGLFQTWPSMGKVLAIDIFQW